MAEVLTLTSAPSAEMMTFYKREFLDTADKVRKYDFLIEKQTFPANSGKTVNFTRTIHFTPITSDAAGEGVNPCAVAFSAETVSAVVSEYKYTTKITSLFKMTTIDTGLNAKSKELGYHMGISLDTLLRNTLIAGATAQYAGSKTDKTSVTSAGTLSVSELRIAHNTLFTNCAPTFENGNYRAVVAAQGLFELKGDTAVGNWINIGLYNSKENADMLKKGVIESLYGFDILASNNQYSESSTVTLYHSLVAGKGAAAEVQVAGSNARLIVKTPGANSTDNPTDAYSTMSWKVDAYSCKVLNANFILDILHA